MKCQVLFFLKNNNKKCRMSAATFLLSALRVKQLKLSLCAYICFNFYHSGQNSVDHKFIFFLCFPENRI